jgi:hypothetical protein
MKVVEKIKQVMPDNFFLWSLTVFDIMKHELWYAYISSLEYSAINIGFPNIEDY